MSTATLETVATPRLDPLQDMPAGLDTPARLAYRLAYNRACLAYVRKNGGPGVVHDGDAPAAGTAARRALGRELARLTREHEIARHPAAHRAGMTAANKSRKVRGLDPIGKPAGRKAPAAPVVVPAPVTPAPRVRKITKTSTCERHDARFGAMTRRRMVETFFEGGPGTVCDSGTCRMWPGTDYCSPDVSTGEYDLTWTTGTAVLTPAPGARVERVDVATVAVDKDGWPLGHHGPARLRDSERAVLLAACALPADPAPVENTPDATAARRDMFRGLGWSVTDPTPAPVEPVDVVTAARASGHLTIVHVSDTAELEPVDVDTAPAVNRTRKLARRELAAAMRARGDDPSDVIAWGAAKLAAGVK